MSFFGNNSSPAFGCSYATSSPFSFPSTPSPTTTPAFGSGFSSFASSSAFGTTPSAPTSTAFGFSSTGSTAFGQSIFSDSSQSAFASSPLDPRKASPFGSSSPPSNPLNVSTPHSTSTAPNVTTTSHASTANPFSSVRSTDAASPSPATPPRDPIVTIHTSSTASSEKLQVAEEEEVPITGGAPSDSTPSDQSDITKSSSPPPPPPPPPDSPHKVPTSRTATIPVINLEVMVEKKNNRVVFAESDEDFIDLLLSFLTLSTGTIINLLEDKSPATVIGCINNLYHSVEGLDGRFFRTEACKDLLLQLRRLPEIPCRNLKQMIEGNLNPAKCFYFCQNSDCRIKGKGLLSEFPNVSCHCGQVMDQLATLSEPAADDGHGGVEEDFLKGGTERFLVSSDLQVMPGSTSQTIMLLTNLGIVDTNELDSQCVAMGLEEMLQLLRLSLLSKAPLTHWILLKDGATTELEELKQKNVAESSDKRLVTDDQKNAAELANKIPVTSDSKKMSVKLFISKSRNKVLFAECGEDFVDFLFSFLTYPLGYILKLLGGKSLLGCFDNLYTSVEGLSHDNYMKSEELKNMLLHPKLALFFACDNQILQVEESCSPQYLLYIDGDSNNEWFVHPLTAKFDGSPTGKGLGLLSMVNPKSSTGETKSGGGFVKGPAKFMVTDTLVVTQLSPISSISFLGISEVPITDVHEKVVVVGEEEALSLMKAALTSETVLTDVFNLDHGISGQGLQKLIP